MAVNQYRFAHREMFYKGLEWLLEQANLSAVSFRDTDAWVMRLYFTLNASVPESGKDAYINAIAKREICSEEFNPAMEPPIFKGPMYADQKKALSNPLQKGDVLLYINAIGSMRGSKDASVKCACFLKRWFGSRGDVDSVIYDILYIVKATGSVQENLPICVGPWCIKNFQPTDDCSLPSECGA